MALAWRLRAGNAKLVPIGYTVNIKMPVRDDVVPMQKQPVEGPRQGGYRVGFHRFSGLSKIHFADCAHAMLGMLSDDTFLHRAPIIQY